MPMHDWTRVSSGTYDNFHHRWLSSIMDALNAGLLPPGLFAMVEQRMTTTGRGRKRRFEPDVLALSFGSPPELEAPDGGIALAAPKTSVIERSDRSHYAFKTNRIVVRQAMGVVVAIVELVSPGNKDRRRALRSFVLKTASPLRSGVHALVVDPFPPGEYDPNGIHPPIWEEFESTSYRQPADKPLNVASYCADGADDDDLEGYVEPFAVGADLPTMPLYLTGAYYVNVPLEDTYRATWSTMPLPIRRELEPNAT